MATQIKFFRKNLIDLDENNTAWTVTDAVATNTGSGFVDLMLNRDNDSGWVTTGSTDAATTTIEVTFNDVLAFDTVIIACHNLKSYTLKYWDDGGAVWADFPTAIAPTANTLDTTEHTFTELNSSKLQLVINSTMTVDADKVIRQFIVTRKIEAGILEGWPIIKKPQLDLSKKPVRMVSGKVKILERVGAFAVSLSFNVWPSDADLTLLEQLHFYHPKGFLLWLSAGDEDQFKYKRIAFRNKDIYLCGITSEWTPTWEKGIYVNGMNMNVKFAEVI